jgi:hypothetical protein
MEIYLYAISIVMAFFAITKAIWPVPTAIAIRSFVVRILKHVASSYFHPGRGSTVKPLCAYIDYRQPVPLGLDLDWIWEALREWWRQRQST